MIICTISDVLRREKQQAEAGEVVFPKGFMRQAIMVKKEVAIVKMEGVGSTHSAS